MYEHHSQPPLSPLRFALRMLRHGAVVLLLGVLSLGVGMAGYEHFERMHAVDAFLNSAMLLGGMGPVDAPKTTGGKLFAGFYALYAGMVFLVAAGLLLAPVVHRVLHRFHWEQARRRAERQHAEE